MAGTAATNPIQIPGISLHDELELLVQSGFTRTRPWLQPPATRRSSSGGSRIPGV